MVVCSSSNPFLTYQPYHTIPYVAPTRKTQCLVVLGLAFRPLGMAVRLPSPMSILIRWQAPCSPGAAMHTPSSCLHVFIAHRRVLAKSLAWLRTMIPTCNLEFKLCNKSDKTFQESLTRNVQGNFWTRKYQKIANYWLSLNISINFWLSNGPILPTCKMTWAEALVSVCFIRTGPR